MTMWIERQRHLLDFTISSLWRRRGRNLSLVLVYAVVVFVIASVVFFAGAIRNEAQSILADAPEMVVQRTIAGRHDLIPVSYADEIRKIRGVRSVEARLWGYYYHPAAGANYTLMVPDRFPHGDSAAEAGQGVLRTWGVTEGGQLYLKTFRGETVVLKVAKALDGSTELISSDLILVSESTFREITGVPEGTATDLAVEIGNLRESQTIAEKVVSAFPDTRPILREEILRTYASVFDWRSGYIVVLLSGSVLAFLIFAWEKATGLSAEERREIGILKGVGWDTADILAMKFWEGAVVSVTAFLLGTTAAYIHVFLASAPLFEHALKGWGVLYPQFKLHPASYAYQLAVLFALTVLPYTFITIAPTWKVSTADPDMVMRQG